MIAEPNVPEMVLFSVEIFRSTTSCEQITSEAIKVSFLPRIERMVVMIAAEVTRRSDKEGLRIRTKRALSTDLDDDENVMMVMVLPRRSKRVKNTKYN